jgi:hypothetical protein
MRNGTCRLQQLFLEASKALAQIEKEIENVIGRGRTK